MTQLSNTLRIDGVTYRLPEWLDEGYGFFMPCLSPAKTAQAVRKHYAPLKIRLEYVERIESDLLGIRIWRVV